MIPKYIQDKGPWTDSTNAQAKKSMGWGFFYKVLDGTSAYVLTYMEGAEHKCNTEIAVPPQLGIAERQITKWPDSP